MTLLVAARGGWAIPLKLSNEFLDASIDGAGGGGLRELRSPTTHKASFTFAGDSVAIQVGAASGWAAGKTLSPGNGLTFHSSTQGETNVSLAWNVTGGGRLLATYTLLPGWSSLAKQLRLELPPPATVEKVSLAGLAGLNLSAGPGEACAWATDYGEPEALNHAAAFHRCEAARDTTITSSSSGGGSGGAGLMLTVTNPFSQLASSATHSLPDNVRAGVTAAYSNVGVKVTSANPTFVSDMLLLAPYQLNSGPSSWIRPHSLGGVDHTARAPAMLNTAERDVFVAAVEAQLLPSPDDGVRTVKVNVAWDENDYQINLAHAHGREEYKRIIDRNADFGVTHMVFGPTNSDLQDGDFFVNRSSRMDTGCLELTPPSP